MSAHFQVWLEELSGMPPMWSGSANDHEDAALEALKHVTQPDVRKGRYWTLKVQRSQSAAGPQTVRVREVSAFEIDT